MEAYIEFNFEQELMILARSRWPILVALGVGSQGAMLLLMRRGNAQGVMLFSRDEDERELYFRELRRQEKFIQRRQSDVAVAYRVSEQLRGPARRMVEPFPFAKDVLGWIAAKRAPKF